MRCPCRHSQLPTERCRQTLFPLSAASSHIEGGKRTAGRVIRHTIQFYENVYSPMRQQNEFICRGGSTPPTLGNFGAQLEIY